MAEQNFKNHVRYYTPHHFIFYPVLTILSVTAFYKAYRSETDATLWLFFGITISLIAILSFMMRQHYALMNQNRIVSLEMRHKYFVLSGKDFEPLEKQLSFGQIAALRFASDEELLALVDRAINENLSPTEIKRSVKHWKADHMRV